MTDSTPQYQRATQQDEAWLQWLMDHATETGNAERADMLRRILNSLRATPAVPDRDALARALYIVDGHDADVQRRIEAWESRYSQTHRTYYGEQADRLVRVLGGFPAVLEQEPRAWECPECGYVGPWAVACCTGWRETHGDVWRENGIPLFAAAPRVETQTT